MDSDFPESSLFQDALEYSKGGGEDAGGIRRSKVDGGEQPIRIAAKHYKGRWPENGDHFPLDML